MEPQSRPGQMLDGKVTGVVILGGAHGTLALARSLGVLNVPVWLVSTDTPLPGLSRHVRKKFDWPGPDDASAIPFLLDLAATHGLAGALLIPGGDGEVRLVSQSVHALQPAFKVMLPAWDQLKWMCEKPLLYRRATDLSVEIPPTYRFASTDEAYRAPIRFPVVLKPNMGGGPSELARAKVIRADDHAGFDPVFGSAALEIGIDNIVVQELIPGGGTQQFSYAALWHAGRPVAEFTARRARQYPVDFGYTSTFVEVVERPDAAQAARKLLASIDFEGLVEIEFKLDPRDGALRLLDVNPRPWSWFGLASAAGLDLGAMVWEIANGRAPAPPSPARLGTAWMYLVRDMVSAAILISRGKLGIGAYLRSFASVRAWATFAAGDPVPGLMDIPVTAWRVLTRRVLRLPSRSAESVAARNQPER
ncbi:ATP-grasp domain-containing protein [Mesorhizobium sp. LHD-90]|uniref:carboxylate--amine ligase n=1 Tax=Mesorhizobium sp. LHD-90 TaxID=3071414 RepID=UPI0027E026D6|nr:ATP-grasp domain-containing protein [Mesorhizobium sp. LHD-90]MDQ6436951.1 ATP-grasp domain-containing protein [Mesorhizobium sp. LHD-90]